MLIMLLKPRKPPKNTLKSQKLTHFGCKNSDYTGIVKYTALKRKIYGPGGKYTVLSLKYALLFYGENDLKYTGGGFSII